MRGQQNICPGKIKDHCRCNKHKTRTENLLKINRKKISAFIVPLWAAAVISACATEAADERGGMPADGTIDIGGCVEGTDKPSVKSGFEIMTDNAPEDITYAENYSPYPDAPDAQIVSSTGFVKIRLTANRGGISYKVESIGYEEENGERLAKIKVIKDSPEIGTDVMVYHEIMCPLKYEVSKVIASIYDEDGNLIDEIIDIPKWAGSWR